MADAMREALEKIAAFDCDSWMIGVKCSGCRTCIAAEALAQHPAMSAADEAEQFIQDAIDRAPEPLRRLGEYLTQILDEDEWRTAERMLIGAAEQPAQGALDGMADRAWQRFEAALAQPEPVAWGLPNTAITGKKMALMMVRLDIPSDDQYGGSMWVPLYTAPPAPAVPDGWKLVPVEPTACMNDAAKPFRKGVGETAGRLWSAMLAAAPEVPRRCTCNATGPCYKHR